MTITIPPELAKRFEELARLRGTTPEAEAVHVLEAAPKPSTQYSQNAKILLADLLALATDCGVSLTDEQLSREEMYD